VTQGRLGRAIWSVLALGSVLTVFAAPTSGRAGIAQAVSVVALGDSVPAGTACHCRPFPSLTADALTASSGQTYTAANDAVAGATSADVLTQLESDSAVIGHVRSANVVEIEIGANDVEYSNACGTSVACYAARLPAMEKNLAAIVTRTRALSPGHKALVVLLDYWNVWLGGKYAAAKGPAYVAAAEQLTDDVDTTIKSLARRSGSAYVDLRAAFKGPDYDKDETRYLATDGDHPNAAGHEQIARATDAVIEKTLHISRTAR
jgi:lysophospholipase L1-like esterase